MNRTQIGLLMALAATSACVDGPETTTTAPQPAETTTVSQPVVDRTGDNWLVAGALGLVEMVGGQDGEPDTLTGRFVMGGNVINDTAAAGDRWILVGNGQSQPVDDDAQRLTDIRTVLQDQPVNFISKGSNNWLIGGGTGQLQLLDMQGEPTNDSTQALAGGSILDGAWNGNSWLVGSTGLISRCVANLSSACGVGQAVLGGDEVRAVVTEDTPTSASAIAWYVFGPDSYQRVSSVGVPDNGGPVLIETGLDIRDAVFVEGKIAVATGNGRFGLFDPTTMATPTWQNLLDGNAASKIEWNGTEFLILGVDGWAQRATAAGAPMGTAVQLATGRTAVGAKFANNRWMIAMGDIGFAEFADAELAPLRTLTPTLSGNINAAEPNTDGDILLVGEAGRMVLVDGLGMQKGDTQQVPSTDDILAASWNGTNFLLAGAGGFTQFADAAGVPMGTKTTQNGGNTIRFAAWSGEFWLIGGDAGSYERLRNDGTTAGNPQTLTGMTTIRDARWNGRAWLVAGEGSTGQAAYALIQRDGTASEVTEVMNFPGSAYAVEFTGLEFLIGGTGGLVQRVSGEGQLVNGPFEALNGFTIRDLFFNGENYLVGGDFGALRRLSPELAPLRAPIAVLDQLPIYAIAWTRNRGFADGLCISDDFCYQGPCVGGLVSGKCCDSACDRACESCFAADTGGTDGTCAPVVLGKQPPSKPNSQGCQRESESTCGQTGFCDGSGECQFYGAEVECGAATCVTGDFTPAALCDGAGECGVVVPSSCAPYNSCSSEGCPTSCATEADCIEGYICDANSACIEDPTLNPDKPDDGGSDDDGGCSTAPSAPAPGGGWLALMGLVGLMAIRRRR